MLSGVKVMNYAEICIIKRDGKREDFSISKIKNAISKAFSASGIQDEQQLVADITMNVISQFSTPTITVEEIQDLVEKSLMKVRPGLYHPSEADDTKNPPQADKQAHGRNPNSGLRPYPTFSPLHTWHSS